MLSRLSVAAWLFSLSFPVLGYSQTASTPPRSAETIATARLQGHVPAFASRAMDLGQIDATSSLSNVVMLLSHTPEQELELQKLLLNQQDPGSPLYRHWLSPEEFGARFGARDADILTVTSWLSSFGLGATVSRSKTFIQVVGNASQLSAAFNTEFHSFNLNGRIVYSLVEEPSLPDSIFPLVKSISGLSQTVDTPSLSETNGNDLIHPQETSNNGTHFIAPGDFATMFDINKAYNAGYNGSGRTIAIIGVSRVNNADVENFGTYTGLNLKDPIVVLPSGSVDPGQTGDSGQREATLDVERASSVAPGAAVSLVIDANGLSGPLHYVIDNKAADIMSMSFSSCEHNASQSTVDTYSALFTQGAAEGITTFVSSGDSGVATCDVHDMPAPATQVPSINLYCASPNVTCVGGTQLNDTANPGMYWSSTNGPNKGSALSYIPEGAFNQPVASNGSFQIFAGGGGPSMYIPKPSWQTGLNVPSDGHRDVPDIAFPSSGHDNYLFCYALTGFPCVPNAQGLTALTGDAGTSAAAPSMAGIQALIDQAEGVPAGNINPRLYALAASMPSTIYHDVTVDSSGVTNCTLDVPSLCNNSTPSPNALTGGLAGYEVGPGYDLVTGWGSVDVYNLLTNWSSGPSLAQAAVSLILPQTTITTAQQIAFSAGVTGNGPTPTGTIQFEVDGVSIQPPVTLDSGMATSTQYMTGLLQVHSVIAIYSGDGFYAASRSSVASLTVTTPVAPIFTVTTTPMNISGQGTTGTSTITVTPVNGFNGTVSFSCSSLGVFGTAPCNFSPSTLTVNGSPGSVTLSLTSPKPSLRQAKLASPESPKPGSRDPLLWGDTALALLCFGFVRRNKRRLLSSILVIVVLSAMVGFDIGCSKTSPTITVTSGVNPATTQVAVTFTATMTAPGSDTTPAGKVQFLSNGVTIGATQTLTNGVATLSQTFTTAGSFAITAQYFGSSSYATVLSSPLTETVSYKNPGAAPGSYTILVTATSGSVSQTVPLQVTVQ